MHCKTWSSCVSGVLCLFAVCASAAEPGFYVIASLGLGEEDPKTSGANFGNSQGIFHAEPESVEVDDGASAWSVGLGYRINRYLAGEVEYIDFGTTDVVEHYNVDIPGTPVFFPTTFDLDYSSTVTGLSLSLLGTLPVGANFELFLRGGALFGGREYNPGFGGQESHFSSTVWLAGAGVTWSFSSRWGIRAEYQQTGEFSESLISGETSVQRMSLSALFEL